MFLERLAKSLERLAKFVERQAEHVQFSATSPNDIRCTAKGLHYQHDNVNT
jgi:hypothetical protein